MIQVSTPDSSIPYRISNQSKNDFTITLPDLGQEEITLSWVALSTKEVTPTLGEALDSDGDGVLDIDEPEKQPGTTVEPQITPTPEPEASLSPSPANAGASPSVTPTPEPSTTPANSRHSLGNCIRSA